MDVYQPEANYSRSWTHLKINWNLCQAHHHRTRWIYGICRRGLTFYKYSQFRLISLRLIEHSRIVTDFVGTGRPHSKQWRDFSLIITIINITSLKITKILGPWRPNLARYITLFFNWSQWTNQIGGYEWFNMELRTFGVFFKLPVLIMHFQTPKLAVFWNCRGEYIIHIKVYLDLLRKWVTLVQVKLNGI